MKFIVLPSGASPPSGATSQAFLHVDNWDDWFTYSTAYALEVFDSSGKRFTPGQLKIGQFGMKEKQQRPEIPNTFDELGIEFFSVGQDESYYETLNELGPQLRDEILRALCDLAVDPDLFARALEEPVTSESLLRSVAASTVRGQFSRIARGGARLSRYHFSYRPSMAGKSGDGDSALTFDVTPESMPPTNIHVLIGRNGVGKTHLLNAMTRSLISSSTTSDEAGYFEFPADDISNNETFANLVSVTFSAFDPFEPIRPRREDPKKLAYFYVGLKEQATGEGIAPSAPKSPSALASDFSKSVVVCSTGPRLPRWRRALATLEADPIFAEANITSLADESGRGGATAGVAERLYENLSSGHKIVLLTMCRLVEVVSEKTLVLLDEPEAHLHPPLLSAFVRALSDLLIDRNGVAIVATHSPVVLQEVPASCVWKIRRSGAQVRYERPEIETFGENVGLLTREVFGLEVTHSGFHKLLRESIGEQDSFESIQGKFDGQLGGEARALLMAMIANNRAERN